MIRKFAFALIVIAMLFGSTAFADFFQLIDRSGGSYIAHAKVLISGQTQTYYTDAYGRINISLPNGSYSAQVTYKNMTKPVTLIVDGSTQLKILAVN